MVILCVLSACDTAENGKVDLEISPDLLAVPVEPITTPTTFAATSINAIEILLTWSEVESAQHYIIYRNTKAIKPDQGIVELLTSEPRRYVDTNLHTNTPYYYWLEACNFVSGCSDATMIKKMQTQLSLNDTGIVIGGNESGNNGFCVSNIDAQQDCNQGRDSRNSTNTNTDGHAGFSFVKLDAEGNHLAADAASWYCVVDKVTGLIWESKSNNKGLHNLDDTYNWVQSSTDVDSENTCYAYNKSDASSHCNVHNFVQKVNAQKLCGYDNWRLPTLEELSSIVNYNHITPSIDKTYFPHTRNEMYWSSSVNSRFEGYGWGVKFSYGIDSNALYRQHSYRVRLVRSEDSEVVTESWADSRYVDHGDGTVTDTKTNLMWKQCSEGQGGTSGDNCAIGSANSFRWKEALEYANNHSFGGYNDWRLPNIKEFVTFVARTNWQTSFVNSNIFPNTAAGMYWSSSVKKPESDNAWHVNFEYGSTGSDSRSSRHYIRLVRGN